MKKFISSSLIAFTIISASLAYIRAAPGDLDRSFGNNGVIKTPFVTGSDMSGSAFQFDGKFVIAGSIFQNGSNQDFYVLRFNANGSLDTTFDGDGVAAIAVSNREDRATGLVLQADGKIVIAGYSRDSNANYDFAVVRLNQNGTRDTTFGNNGVVITSTSTYDDYASNVIVQPDNKIVVCGKGIGNNGMNFTVVRYNSDGSLDTSFDGDGIARTQFPTGVSTAEDLKLQADGKIVVAGVAGLGDFTYSTFGFARYNTNGSLDTSFGTNGTVVADVNTGTARQNAANELLIQTDGKIVAVGYSNSGFTTDTDFAVARLNSDGSLDNSFGNNGRIVTPIQNSYLSDGANTVALQSDGKLLVGGIGRRVSNDADFTLVRYNSNGTLDTRFGDNGIAVTRLVGNGEAITNLRIEADGKIFAAGLTNFEITFVRY